MTVFERCLREAGFEFPVNDDRRVNIGVQPVAASGCPAEGSVGQLLERVIRRGELPRAFFEGMKLDD